MPSSPPPVRSTKPVTHCSIRGVALRCRDLGSRSGVHPESMWSPSGVAPEFRGRTGTDLGSSRGRPGVEIWGRIWGRVGVAPGSICGRFGRALCSIRGRSGAFIRVWDLGGAWGRTPEHARKPSKYPPHKSQPRPYGSEEEAAPAARGGIRAHHGLPLHDAHSADGQLLGVAGALERLGGDEGRGLAALLHAARGALHDGDDAVGGPLPLPAADLGGGSNPSGADRAAGPRRRTSASAPRCAVRLRSDPVPPMRARGVR